MIFSIISGSICKFSKILKIGEVQAFSVAFTYYLGQVEFSKSSECYIILVTSNS